MKHSVTTIGIPGRTTGQVIDLATQLGFVGKTPLIQIDPKDAPNKFLRQLKIGEHLAFSDCDLYLDGTESLLCVRDIIPH